MITDENRAAIQHINDEIARGNADIIDRYYAPDFIQHPPSPGDSALSESERQKQLFAAVRAAFPDVQITVDDLIAEGDRLAWRAARSPKPSSPSPGGPCRSTSSSS